MKYLSKGDHITNTKSLLISGDDKKFILKSLYITNNLTTNATLSVVISKNLNSTPDDFYLIRDYTLPPKSNVSFISSEIYVDKYSEIKILTSGSVDLDSMLSYNELVIFNHYKVRD